MLFTMQWSQEETNSNATITNDEAAAGHSFTTQGGAGQGCGGGQGWQSGPPTCYCCGAIGHIATNCPEIFEDAQ